MNQLETNIKRNFKRYDIKTWRMFVTHAPDFLCMFKKKLFFVEAKQSHTPFSLASYSKTKQFQELTKVPGFLLVYAKKKYYLGKPPFEELVHHKDINEVINEIITAVTK